MMVFWSNNAMCLIYVSHCLQSEIHISDRIQIVICLVSSADFLVLPEVYFIACYASVFSEET